MGQKTLFGIMALVLVFLIIDIAIFSLMFFNVKLGEGNLNMTDNNTFNNLTDNTVVKTITPKITSTTSPTLTTKTDNSVKQ